MRLEDVCKRFIRMKKLSGLSRKSIYDYESFVKMFVNFVGADSDIFDMVQSDIENYIEYQIDRDIAHNTFVTYIRNLKIFVRWVCDNYDVNFTYKSIKVPKGSKKVVRIYSDTEIRQIFAYTHSPVFWIELRNKTMISFMLDSGIRQGEVCSLKHADLDCDKMRMVINGKGNKQRIVPIGHTSILFYKDYCSCCPFDSEFIFLTKGGEPVTTNTVKLMISKLARKVPFELSSHKLRHNFATNYCLDMYWKYGKIDIYRLMVIMGHEDIETTRRYLHIANEIIAGSESLSHLDMVLGN